MDYFFWDDIFGTRQQIADELLPALETHPDEPDVRLEVIPVVIAWVDLPRAH